MIAVGTRIIWHAEEVSLLMRSHAVSQMLGREALKVKRIAQANARVDTGKLRRQIRYYVATDAYSAYADIGTNAKRKGFRYGAYWNAIDHYLDDAIR